MKNTLDRRRFLHGLGALGSASLLGELSFGRDAAVERSLVLIQLSGGNDGLSTIVPCGDDAYHRARNATHIATEDVLRLDDYRGFHPALERLHTRYSEGGVGVIQGVGYADPSRSHFKSMDVWHSASARGRSVGEGWIGRVCRAVYHEDASPERVVHIGGNTPYSLFSTLHPPLAMTAPRSYRWIENEDELGRMSARSETTTSEATGREASLRLLRRAMRDAHASSQAIRSAVASYRPHARYPAQPFADDLRTAAALIHAGLGTRVVSIELGGFDTHGDQRNRHDRLMRTLDTGLAAFLEDMEESEVGRETLVVVFSEFGRRVAENASRGTDHGCAGPMLVAGSAVKGGLYGAHPSLTELDEGDLVYTTDFRSVYASAIEWVFGVDPGVALNADYSPVRFV